MSEQTQETKPTGKESKPPTDNDYHPTWGSVEVPRRARGVVEKCTFCVHRIDRGLEQGLMPGVDRAATPACVNVCPVGARVFGDANDPDSPLSEYMRTHPTFRLLFCSTRAGGAMSRR